MISVSILCCDEFLVHATYVNLRKLCFFILFCSHLLIPGTSVRMGVYLSTPKTEKLSENGGNDKLKFGLSSMQGWRATMEDAVSSYLSIIIARFDLFVLFSPFTYRNPQNVPKAKMKFIELLLKDSLVMNSACIHLRAKGPNIYMYRRGRIYKEPPGEI
jgi:hypothetical protein